MTATAQKPHYDPGKKQRRSPPHQYNETEKPVEAQDRFRPAGSVMARRITHVGSRVVAELSSGEISATPTQQKTAAIMEALEEELLKRKCHGAVPQTFGFENCVDLHWKLYWEIARLHHATPHDVTDMKCFAFNAAVTAWHLTDWVFEDMTPAQRSQYGTPLKAFQNFVRRQCRPIHLCRQIATASKHRSVILHADQDVGAGIDVKPHVEGQFSASWNIYVTDGAVTYPALDVLEESRLYWYRFISGLGLMDD
jgi:hypothetical protein